MEMELHSYNDRYVRVEDIGGEAFEGLAEVFPAGYGLSEFGREEESIKIEDRHIFVSDIRKIELFGAHGTAELGTERLRLRRHRPEDALSLCRDFGRDEEMYRYSGWNPYATKEMAEETVRTFIESYGDDDFYCWAVEFEDLLVGTVGAYDHDREKNSIEAGISIFRPFQGHGFAGEALEAVLKYLTENEGIACVSAWCAADNFASRKALEKAGMKQVGTAAGAIEAGGRVYDKLIYEYRSENGETPRDGQVTAPEKPAYQDEINLQ